MAEFDELVEVLKHLLLNKFAPKPDFIRGILGDGLGNVLITDRPDYNLVRFNRSSTETFEIFNKEVTAVDGWPVLIGEFPWQPGLTQVVGTDLAAYEQSGWGTAVSGPNAHAPTHEWPDGSPGSDPLSVYMRAIVPLRAYSSGSGSSTVFVNSYEFDFQETGTIWPGVPGVDLSPIMSTTATGTARFVGVYLDPGANILGVVTGTTTVHTPAFDPPLIAFPAGMIPSARIKVFGGQADIGDADIRDARRPFVPGITGSAGGGAPTGPAGGDLTGSYPNPTVKGLQTQPVSSASPAEGEVFMWTGSIWQPHTIPATVPTGLAGGDLSGSYPDPQVVGLFSSPVSSTTPSPGDLLYFTGSIWQPVPLPTQAIPFGLAGGDLTGSFPNPQVAGLFGSSLLGNAPAEGDTLMFTGSAWRPLPDPTTADAWAFRVKNTSGAVASIGDVGFIDEAGEYKTTTTAQDDVVWCVVRTNGSNNADIFVTRRGRVTVNYIGGAPSTGDFLVTSTTAGSAQQQITMRPEIFAVCVANGAGGTVEALLLCHTKYVQVTSATDILFLHLTDDSDWRTTINGAPAGAVVTYTAPLTSGNENTIQPFATTNQFGKIRLYNETDADYALIDDVDQAANTITLTANAPAGWANAEVITTRSQTCVVGAAPFFYDIDLSSADNTLIPKLARTLEIEAAARDTAGVGNVLWAHPFETFASAKVKQVPSYEANVFSFRPMPIALIEQRFCILFFASGAATASVALRISGWWEAAP